MPRYSQSNLAACMIPWTPQYQLDVVAFQRHIQSAIDGGYRCMYVMGTAGEEGYALSDRQFQEVVEVFAAQAVGGDRDPQVGVISLSMQTMLDRIAWCRLRGIRMFQISLPSWGALDDAEAMLFFKTVCGSFPDCRFLHYNLPRTKRILTGKDYRRVADAVPNLVATKNSTYDYARTADLLHDAPDLQHFLLENNFAMGCTIGECSLLCSFGVLRPDLTWRFFRAGVQRDIPELFRITEVFRQLGSRLFAHCQRSMIDGAFDKTLVWLRSIASYSAGRACRRAGGGAVAVFGALPELALVGAGEHGLVLLDLVLEDRDRLRSSLRGLRGTAISIFVGLPLLPRAAVEPDLAGLQPVALLRQRARPRRSRCRQTRCVPCGSERSPAA
jgi:dihydrodipicolinate synthase/N-acetylneuraminate lyase